MASYNNIKVVARFRPQNKIEVANGGEPIVNFDTEETCSIRSKEAAGSFTFDRVFGMDSHQPEVFEFSIRSTVDDILKGYNGTVFAYGQTGAGKSYTMMGDIDDEAQKGIIPRIVEQIFASILASPGNIEYTVRVGYMEIYMERIRDLLRPENDNLPIHEEKSRGVYVKELTELYVSSVDEVYEVMRRGAMTRAVAATNMNQESSRSHSIFVITITQKNVETGSSKSGQLFLVDLAGSEKVGKTGASGQTLEEAKKINKSLSALGMVINALTDGKSTHIPYRDSKLTRILQESLGGNSRTTLIINCSPSSYNDQETVSTLRFGVRAKSIKNKAKINAELSVTELKIMLKKVQTQVQTFEQYIQSLHGEVQQWRSGEAVPKEAWIQPLDGVSKKADAKPTPSTPSRGPAADVRRSETPSRPDSRMELERAGTPSTLDKDERDEFLRRENDLQDQLSERETQLADAEKALKDLRDELGFLREHDARATKDNERLTTEVNELRMQTEKLSFEAKEDRITMDGLKEANTELTAELDDVKTQLLETRMSARESGGALDGKERLKRERMAEMMAGFDLGDDAADGVESADTERLRAALAAIDEMLDADKAPVADATALETLRQRLLEASPGVRGAASAAARRAEAEAVARSRRDALEARLAKLQAEHEALLEGKLDGADAETLKARLADAYAARREAQDEKVGELEEELRRRSEDAGRLRGENEELRARVAVGAVNGAENGMGDGKAVERQIAEFDNMKKSLMRDLQNRCERVVELEISLDETREQYNNVLRTSNNRAQQKKMAFLERNLEQLTVIQRQLVEQNNGLKKEVAIAERKLIARNERIQSLEHLLADSQEKLVQTNHRFESQLSAVKERLEAAKAGSTRGLATLGAGAGGPAGFPFGGARIAKPLRGGGAAPAGPGAGQQHPQHGFPSAAAALQAQENGGGKRGNWFFG